MKYLTSFHNLVLQTKEQPLKKIFLPAIVFVIVSCGATLPAQADPVIIDQSSTVADALVGFQTHAPIGQEFTPTLPSLNFVELFTRDTNQINGIGATLRVNIRLGSIGGAIVGTSDDLVLPDQFGVVDGDVGGGVTHFNFATPVTLIPGNIYVIQAVQVSGDDPWALFLSINNPYSGGRAIFSGNLSPFSDLYFVEGVQTPAAVPEPTTMLLLGTGLIGIAAKMRKRRRCV